MIKKVVALILGLSLFCGVKSLTDDEIRAFKARPWIEGNTGVQGRVAIIDNGNGVLRVQSNGIPDHPTGTFDGTRGNPNHIYPHQNLWKIPKTPQMANTSTCLPMGTIAVAINGVSIYNPFSAGCCDAGEAELNLFDICWGHPSPDNRYHYHTAPLCLFENVCNTSSGIIGVALDGFPLYGPIDEDGTELHTSDLDECHGKYASDGSYRYHVTAEYPYMFGCFKGKPLSNSGLQRGCNCDINNPVDPCEEFGGPPPRPLMRAAMTGRNIELLRMFLGENADGNLPCCTDANNCDYVYNNNTMVPTS